MLNGRGWEVDIIPPPIQEKLYAYLRNYKKHCVLNSDSKLKN